MRNLLRLSERTGPEHFPAGFLQPLLEVAIGRALEHLLDEFAGAGRCVEEDDAARHGAAVLPGVRHVARHEATSARPAGRHLVADPEGELALEHPGDLVAVT